MYYSDMVFVSVWTYHVRDSIYSNQLQHSWRTSSTPIRTTFHAPVML